MRKLVALVSFVCFLTGASAAMAQRRSPQKSRSPAKTASPRPSSQRPAPPVPVLPDIRNDLDVKEADVAIIANITATELRFDVVGNPTVEFFDKPKTRNIWHADRFNLPDRIEPGVTYRNIGIRLKITSRLADIDRIVAEALGEIPATAEPSATVDQITTTPEQSVSPQTPVAPASDQKAKKVPGE